MPTGYTAGVQDGTVTEFKDFALACARAMGACIMQRDDNLDDLPKIEKESEYYRECLAETEDKLNHFKESPVEELHSEFIEWKIKIIKEYRESIKRRTIERERYENMLRQVEGWQPPTDDHKNFKKFMIDQINSSIESDCGLDYWEKAIKETVNMEFIDWFESRISSYYKDIEYYTKHLKEEQQTVQERNDWKIKLFESLGLDLTTV